MCYRTINEEYITDEYEQHFNEFSEPKNENSENEETPSV